MCSLKRHLSVLESDVPEEVISELRASASEGSHTAHFLDSKVYVKEEVNKHRY